MIPTAADEAPRSPRHIALLFFGLGFLMMLVQTQLARELMVSIRGDEISLGILFAAWLLSVCAGSFAGIAVRQGERLPAVLLGLAPLALAGLLVARATWIFAPAAGAIAFSYPRALSLSLLAVSPFAFCAGLAFTMAAALSPTPVAVRLYVAEALGALLAGLACTFLWAGYDNPFRLLAWVALPLAAMAWLAGRGRPRGRLVGAMHGAIAALPLLLLIPGSAERLNSWTNAARWRSISSLRLVAARSSRYQYLQLGEAGGQFSLYGSGQLAAVFPDPDADFLLAAQLLAQPPAVRRVVVIGDVSAGLGGQLLRFGIVSLTAVELDPLFSAMVARALSTDAREALRDPRLRLETGDGRRFVQQLSRQVSAGHAPPADVLLLNLPEPSTALLNRFYTREFFADAAAALAPGGVMALRPTALASYSGGAVGRYDACLYRTLRDVFPDVLAVPGPPCLFFAAKRRGLLSADGAVLARRLRLRGGALPDMGMLFRSLLQPDAVRFLNGRLAADAHPDVNRDDRPVAYFLFGQTTGRGGAGTLLAFLEMVWRGRLPLLAAVGALLLFLLVSPRRRRTSRLLFLSSAAGLSGMGLQLLLIFRFQSAFGQLYWAVGLLSALFMSGLAGGAAIGHRLAQRRQARPAARWRLLLLGQAGFALLAALQPLLGGLSRAPQAAGWAAFAVFGVLAGAFTGGLFPLALSLLADGSGRGAGWLYACDHLGGAIGAFLVPALLLPLFGLNAGSAFMALLLAGSAAGVALQPGTIAAGGGSV